MYVEPRSRPRVLVIHSGARHNYALPAAFAEAGMLEGFYTDVCAGRGIGRAAEAARAVPMPKRLAAMRDRLAGRRLPALVLERTWTDDLETLRHEAERRCAKDEAGRIRALHRHERRRGRRLLRHGLGRATHVFNVLGEGGDLLDMARSRGLTVLADIIIALSTDAIVRREYEAFPDWGPAPVDRAAAIGGGNRAADHLLRTTDVHVCPSPFVADDLVANWGVDRGATRIVPYAISDTWFSLTPRPVPGRVLFVGSADRRKGIHYLAMAADGLRARRRRYEFRVAGGVAPEVSDKPLCRPLSFLGRVPRASVANEFATADVLVLPTLAEGSASVTYEALAAGVPVITTKAAGSVVRHDVDGLIVPERDPDALATAIEDIVEDRGRRDAMAAAARAHAPEYSWSRYGERLLQAALGLRHCGFTRCE
jgi:glycosyltransferase involved in cell wall biosynthesis